mgnify:CR=1 FL=1
MSGDTDNGEDNDADGEDVDLSDAFAAEVNQRLRFFRCRSVQCREYLCVQAPRESRRAEYR